MPLLPGAILNKRYRIVSLLAEGRYGAVYRAYDTAVSAHVAIKEYLDPSVETQQLFRTEARRLSKLSHPQLPNVLDHFALEDVGQYLVTEYIDGVDLQSLINQYGLLPSDLIVTWLQEAAKPLGFLHEQGTVHLDVKPANIRLTPDGRIFLVDTGLPGLGIRPHSPGYGAPEQQAQQTVSPASDIYSLGATLYALLTGQTPPQAIARESGLEELKPAREVNPDVEPYLSLVAGRAMSLRADTRYETVADFARALQRPIGQPVTPGEELRRTPSAVPAAPPPRLPMRRWRSMEPRTLAALAVTAVLVVAVIAFLTFANVEPQAEQEAAATATLQSAVVAALTAIAPTPTPLPVPTLPPTPTPEPFIAETGARMLYVPGGIFRMGDDEGEPDERPSHIIRLDPYFIDETEVTNGQYALCVEAGVCSPPARSGATYHESYYGDPAFDDYPVLFVNWYDAQTFCEWRGARLPSEAEWEMAASYDPEQASKLRYPWGDAFDGEKLNFCDVNCTLSKRDASVNDGHADTAPVGSYADGRSPIGAYDMLGNVMEWVSDWYDPRYYYESTDTNPFGPTEGEFKALRGGSWLSAPEDLSVTIRSSFDPTVERANLGFRCAMAVP